MLSARDESVREVLALVEHTVQTWRFDEAGPALAAAGVGHGGRLLTGALSTLDHEHAAGDNVLVRTAFEFWLVGTYALIEGDEAVLAMERSFHEANEKMARLNQIEGVSDALAATRDILDELVGGRTLGPTKVDQIAGRIRSKVVELSDGQIDPVAAYDLVYRVHSTNDVHAVSALGRMIAEDDNGQLFVKLGGDDEQARTNVWIMTMHLCELAHMVEVALGRSTEQWRDRRRQLMRSGEP